MTISRKQTNTDSLSAFCLLPTAYCPMNYLKTNWPHLLVTLLGSVCSTAFVLGFAWAVLGNRVANAERRLDDIDRAHVDETHWQVQQHTASINAAQVEARQADSELAQINVRLGVIESKLDALTAALRQSASSH